MPRIKPRTSPKRSNYFGLLNTLNCKDYCLYVGYIQMGNVVMNIEVGHDETAAAENLRPLAGRTEEI